MIEPAYAASGFGVGLLVGLTGVGGGSLMTPLLILLFGVHPMTAVGTDLLQASMTKAAGSVVHGAHRNVDWRIVRRLLAGSMPAAVATLVCLKLSGADAKVLSHLLSTVLGGALLLTALSVAFRPWLVRVARRRVRPLSPRAEVWSTVAVGAVVGAMVSLLVGSVPGIVVGSLLVVRLPEGVVRGVLAALLVVVGQRLVW